MPTSVELGTVPPAGPARTGPTLLVRRSSDKARQGSCQGSTVFGNRGAVAARRGSAQCQDAVMAPEDFLDYSGRDDVLSGGARMIPIRTPSGTFRVWTKRIGNNPRPQGAAAARRPRLRPTNTWRRSTATFRRPASSTTTTTSSAPGSATSPTTPSLWELDRFVDEVEQVRAALGLDRDNFYLLRAVLGRHPRDRVRAAPPAAAQGPGDLQHDGERPGIQRLCRATC